MTEQQAQYNAVCPWCENVVLKYVVDFESNMVAYWCPSPGCRYREVASMTIKKREFSREEVERMDAEKEFVLAYVCDPEMEWEDAYKLAVELDKQASEEFVNSVSENEEV